jgi:hypothetical protein
LFCFFVFAFCFCFCFGQISFFFFPIRNPSADLQFGPLSSARLKQLKAENKQKASKQTKKQTSKQRNSQTKANQKKGDTITKSNCRVVHPTHELSL